MPARVESSPAASWNDPELLMRRTIILAAAVAIIGLGLWGTAVIYFDESRLKGILSDRLSEQVGRRVEIAGELRFTLFPSPVVEAGDVLIAGSGDGQGPAMMRARNVSMSLRFLPLLRGELAPVQMQLSGAVINLGGDGSEGAYSDPLAAVRSSARLLSGRSLRLEDVTLVFPEDARGRPNSITLDFIEFERFSLDRAVSFRFEGNLGDPPVVDRLRVEGTLHVPADAGRPVRLRDMQMQGHLIPLEEHLSVSGDLTATPDEPFRLALAGGQLQVGPEQFDLSFTYHGGEKPAADLLVSGRVLDWKTARDFSLRRMQVDPEAFLAALSSRVDLRSQLQFDVLQIGGLEFADARIDLRSRNSGLGLNLLTTFPGGLVEASGVLTGQASESLAMDISLAEFGRLLEWLGWPAVIDGSGESRLSLIWPVEDDAGYRIEGRFDLWDGYWQVGDADSEAQTVQREFDQFTGDFRMTPGFLELPGFELRGEDLSGSGWAAVELPEGTLGGEVLTAEGEFSFLALSGTLDEPRLAPLVDRTDAPSEIAPEAGEPRQ